MLEMKRILLATILVSCAGCAAGEPKATIAQATAACDPKPCATLNAKELSILSPYVERAFKDAQQEYNNLGAVIQDVQKQTGQKHGNGKDEK